jgi:uncharacterized protein YkwD
MKKISVIFFWCVFVLFVFVKHVLKTENTSNPDARPEIKQQVEEFNVTQKKLLDLHNKERKAKGYEPLVLDRTLCDYAQKHAEKMAKTNSLSHSSMSSLQEAKKDAGFVGENIAWGQENPEDVVSAWMWSPGHRWNILGSKYKKVGFGLDKDKNNKNYWCVVLSD